MENYFHFLWNSDGYLGTHFLKMDQGLATEHSRNVFFPHFGCELDFETETMLN